MQAFTASRTSGYTRDCGTLHYCGVSTQPTHSENATSHLPSTLVAIQHSCSAAHDYYETTIASIQRYCSTLACPSDLPNIWQATTTCW